MNSKILFALGSYEYLERLEGKNTLKYQCEVILINFNFANKWTKYRYIGENINTKRIFPYNIKKFPNKCQY